MLAIGKLDALDKIALVLFAFNTVFGIIVLVRLCNFPSSRYICGMRLMAASTFAITVSVAASWLTIPRESPNSIRDSATSVIIAIMTTQTFLLSQLEFLRLLAPFVAIGSKTITVMQVVSTILCLPLLVAAASLYATAEYVQLAGWGIAAWGIAIAVCHVLVLFIQLHIVLDKIADLSQSFRLGYTALIVFDIGLCASVTAHLFLVPYFNINTWALRSSIITLYTLTAAASLEILRSALQRSTRPDAQTGAAAIAASIEDSTSAKVIHGNRAPHGSVASPRLGEPLQPFPIPSFRFTASTFFASRGSDESAKLETFTEESESRTL
ncbi:hypothetical protein BC831DRAFT_510232 [Entophlyctis helioformis]|nr:hypothetical protein BC831DRAFT_510232 [Entophlyctis helioformis]